MRRLALLLIACPMLALSFGPQVRNMMLEIASRRAANPIVFEDDFETGDFSKWTAAGARFSVQSDVVYDGVYAVKGESYTSDVAARILSFDFSEPLVSARITVYFRASSTVTYAFFMIHSPDYGLVPYGGKFQYYDGAYKDLPVATTFAANQWYKCVVEFYAETNTIKYWIDDAYKGSHQNIAFANIPSVYSILRSTHPGVDFYIDNVKVEDLSIADPLPE